MTNVIFQKEDFVLCDVPVPKGYPQSQTHTGVAFFQGKYYLTTSPYPSPVFSSASKYFYAILRRITFGRYNKFIIGENYENPCIYQGVSNEYNDIPTKFILLNGCPLMDKPEDKYGFGSYCSDPDLYIDDGTFCIINRTSFRRTPIVSSINDYEIRTYLITGRPENGIFIIDKINLLEGISGGSPCLIKLKDRYIILSIRSSSYNTGEPCDSINAWTSNAKDGIWTYKGSLKLYKGIYEPWHMSVFSDKGRYYSVIACIKRGEKQRCWQMLGEFSGDMTELRIFQTPLTDYKSYRASAIVNKEGEFILYETTVNEKIKKGKSVDGREVLMAHKPFSQLLSEIKSKETV